MAFSMKLMLLLCECNWSKRESCDNLVVLKLTFHEYLIENPVTHLLHAGFLKTRSSQTPGTSGGNLGVLDIMAALQWTKENIAAFGGDPTRVTIVGHDTGAALANLVLISKTGKCRFLDQKEPGISDLGILRNIVIG